MEIIADINLSTLLWWKTTKTFNIVFNAMSHKIWLFIFPHCTVVCHLHIHYNVGYMQTQLTLLLLKLELGLCGVPYENQSKKSFPNENKTIPF